MSSTPLLAARGVTRRFGADVALAPTDLALGRGEVIALVGPNGAGKSTLLAVLAGALPPSGGVVERAEGVRVGWAPQKPAHYARLSARENLELFARLGREAEPGAIAERMLARFELPRDRRPSGTLSSGNRQRLNLALALVGDPDVLLLDEPAASLDPERRATLWAAVREVRARGGAVLFATQHLDEIERVADGVVALYEGAASFSGSAAAFEASQG